MRTTPSGDTEQGESAPATTSLLAELATDPESLPSPDGVALEVVRILEDPYASINELEDTIATDPGLTAKLLRATNSGLFSPGQEVTSIQRAAMLLGFRSLRVLALSFTLSSAIPRSGVFGSFPLDQFWQRSVTNAVIARKFALQAAPVVADDAYVAGLLGHVGRYALASRAPEAHESTGGDWPDSATEKRALGFTTDSLSRALLDVWGVPESVGTAIEHRSDREDTGSSALVLVLRAALAAEQLLTASDDDASGWGRLVAIAAELDVGEEDLEQLMLAAEMEIIEFGGLLDLRLGPIGVDNILERLRVAEMIEPAPDLRIDRRAAVVLAGVEATVDAMTGLVDQGGFESCLARITADRQAQSRPGRVGLILVEVDRPGQEIEPVMIDVTPLLVDAVRNRDMVGRVGLRQFAIALTETTTIEAWEIAERLCRNIPLALLHYPELEIAAGVTTVGDRHLEADLTITIAANALERAIQRGSGHVVVDEA
ncbi:MAG: HDOD domain-containing protein [Actinomycetia bacterium]|nr:HDOD domain-containing protein [Actinomycetes bacterium]